MMKKLLCAAAAAVLCFSAVCASAQVTVSEKAEGADLKWITGSGCLYETVELSDGKNADGEKEGDKVYGYALVSADGARLSDPVYTDSFTAAYGHIIAEKAGGNHDQVGLIDEDLTQLIPFEYGAIAFFSDEWAGAYRLTPSDSGNYDFKFNEDDDARSYWLIDTVDIWYLPELRIAATLPREHFARASAVGHSLNVEDRADDKVTTYDKNWNRLGGDFTYISEDESAQEKAPVITRIGSLYGLTDEDGYSILDPKYDNIYPFHNGYAVVKSGDWFGLIDENGKEVLPAQFSDVLTSRYGVSADNGDSWRYEENGVFIAADENRTLSFVRAGGVLSAAAGVSKDAVETAGSCVFYKDGAGVMHVIAADGTETSFAGYKRVSCMAYSAGRLFKICNEDDDYGVADLYGNVLIPCEYDSAALSGDGKTLLVKKSRTESTLYTVNY